MADIGGPWTLVVPRHQGTKAPVNTCAWPLTSAVPAPLAESCRRRPPARCSQVRRRACAVRNARMLASWVACAGPPQCVRGARLTTCGRPRPFWRLLPARRSRPSSQPCGVVRCWSCCWWLDARLVWARYATGPRRAQCGAWRAIRRVHDDACPLAPVAPEALQPVWSARARPQLQAQAARPPTRSCSGTQRGPVCGVRGRSVRYGVAAGGGSA